MALQSMTGFGLSSAIISGKKIIVEIRTLNSKGTDVYLKIPAIYKSFEVLMRKKIDSRLLRGKIECSITEELIEPKSSLIINKKIVADYYKELKELSFQLDVPMDNVLSTILNLPDVFQSEGGAVDNNEWQYIKELIDEALDKTIEFRLKEGETLKNEFSKAVSGIEDLLKEVPKYEKSRIEQIKERISNNFEQFNGNVDQNRLEQELIYYIEKLDISEEKSRLQHHLDYFRQTMLVNDAIGRKLGFITQEIGREINTLGSKSYNADLQKIVVNMKDYLEKIKEQVFNTL